MLGGKASPSSVHLGRIAPGLLLNENLIEVVLGGYLVFLEEVDGGSDDRPPHEVLPVDVLQVGEELLLFALVQHAQHLVDVLRLVLQVDFVEGGGE